MIRAMLFICLSFLSFSIHAEAALKGRVMIDGSSTVFPITEAVAEDFRNIQPRVRVAIGVSGTGGGFKKYLNGETDINNASRTIKEKEISLAKKNQIKFKEIPVAYDGISVVINKDNDWATDITVSELKKIWQPGSKVTTWKDVRPTWPDKPIRLYGPGTDSGTFEYFTHAINGKAHHSRSNYTKSEDDNMLVQGVVSDKYAMAYFGFAYYTENKGRIKAIPVKLTETSTAIAPSLSSINDGSYKPLARPVFIYVNPDSLKANKSVFEFTRHYLKSAARLVKDVGYVPLPDSEYQKSLKLVETLGSVRVDSVE